MKKFVVHYHAPAEAMAKMATATEEEKMAGMEPWMAWKAKYDDRIVDFGAPMMGAHRIDGGGGQTQAVSAVTGYSIIEADDINDAKSMLTNHPHLSWADGCAIEVFECIPMG